MFLHLGDDFAIPMKEIIGIFDIGSVFNSISSQEFLEISKNEKRLIQIGNQEKNKSFILTQDSIYLSQISTYTLFKRTSNILEE